MAEGPRAFSRSDVRKSPAFEVQTRFANEPYRCENYGDGRPIELTSLWEHVQRMRRLPHGLDRNALFRELASRMGYPEWEVRQHALRVLADLAPILPPSDVSAALDSPMLLPATINCLGHPSSAVRRAALDALRALLVASEDPDMVVDALVIHGLDGADAEVAMGVILGVPALLSPRLPHQGLVRLVSALARKVIHSAFHEEALETLSKIRSLVGEGQFDRFLSGFPPKYRRDFRALFRAHDVRSDNEDSSAETRARVKEMLASGLLSEVEEHETKRIKIEPTTSAAVATSTTGKHVEKKESPAAAPAKAGRQLTKTATIRETTAEDEEIDSANGSRPASADTRTEEKGEEPDGGATKADTLQVPGADKEDEDEATISDNDRTSVDTRGKGSEGGGGTEEEGGELEDDEDSGVEGSGGRGEEGTEPGATSPPPHPAVAGRVLLETEIQFSEATAITMTILEEADEASNDGDPGNTRGSRIAEEEFDQDFAIRVLETSDDDETGKVREVGRPSAGRRVRFGGEMVLQTPDSSAETLEVPKKEEVVSAENSSEDLDAASKGSDEGQSSKANGQFVSHIPVRIEGSKRQSKNAEGDKAKRQEDAEEADAAEKEEGGETREEPEVITEDTKVKLEAEGTEVELLVQVVSGDLQEGEVNSESPPEPPPKNRIHSWEDLGIVDKLVLVDIRNKEDWQARGRGMQILKTALRDPAVSSMLYPHLPEFLLFLEPLLEDRSIPVVTAALGAVRNLASAPSLRPRLSSPGILRRLTSSLCRRAAHAHVAVRAAAASAAKALMRATGPRTLLPSLLTLASAPRAPGHRVRESALLLALHALLAFPSGDFDAIEVARRAVPALADPKRRVRQAALECMAVLAQFVPQSSLPLSLASENLRSRKARRAMEAAVSARLSRRRLPVLTADGLILYALQIPPTASRGMPGTPTGADVDWILAGTGSISSGSAMSRGHYVINRSDSPLLPTTVAQVPVYNSGPPPTAPPRNRPDSPAAWGSNSPWMESRRNQETPSAIGPSAAEQRSHSAETDTFSFVPLRGGVRDAQKPASSPCVGTSGVPGVATLSPWSAAARGEDGRRKPPALQVASLSSSFSSSTSSTSSASSASTTSSNNPPTIGYFRPVYHGPRHLGVIEDVVSERGFSILPDKMTPANAMLASPGKAGPIHGQTHGVQGSRRLRSPSPPTGRRRRQLAPLSHQSSTDSRPSSPTSNDSSIPPHTSAPLPIHSQTAVVNTGRWGGGGPRRTAQPAEDTSTTNQDCTNETSSGQERFLTSDDSSTPSRSDSTVRRRGPVGMEEVKKTRRPQKNNLPAEAAPAAPADAPSTSSTSLPTAAPALTATTDVPTAAPIAPTADPTAVPTASAPEGTGQKETLEEETRKETGEGAEPGTVEATAETDDATAAAVAAGSAISVALAEVEGSTGEALEAGNGTGVGDGEGIVEKLIRAAPEEAPPMPHPCVPEGIAEEKEGERREEEKKGEEKEGGKGEGEKEEVEKEGVKDGEEEKKKEVNDKVENNKAESNKAESNKVESNKEANKKEANNKEEKNKDKRNKEKKNKEEQSKDDRRNGDMKKESKEEGKLKEDGGGERMEKGEEEGKSEKKVGDEGGKEGVGEEEGGKEEGAEGGEGAIGAVVQVFSVQKDETDATSAPTKAESNCGGVAVPIDLSVGLLGADIDDRLKESSETGAAFTTLPPDSPFSPPPRPKHLSCSYPSGTIQLSAEEIEEHPMSASFVVQNAKGTDDSTVITSSSVPNTVYVPKNHGHSRNQKSSIQHREGRRSLPARNGLQKHSVSSVASAPNVHPGRSSSISSSLFPETLPPVKNPKESLKQAFLSMDDPDWEVAMKGLETMVRLIRHHPSHVQAELTKVIATLARQIRNLRSQVARAACQASGELALPRISPSSPSSITSDCSNSSASTSLLRRALEADLEEVAAPLLHRSADTNRFLRDDCVAALDKFVAGVGPTRVMGPILSKGVTHQNALVRTVTARLLATIVAKLGAERVMTQLNKDVRAKVLRAGANLLMEGSLQTRTFAKQVFRCLACHESFDRALAQAVPTPVLRNIQKTLVAIKKESIASNGVDPNWDA